MARFITFGVAAVFMLCLFKPALSCSCFVPREPCVYQTCGCPETPAGIVSCCGCPAYTSSTTACSTCASCFRDAACPCKTCPEKSSPVCSCLKSLDSSCGCGCKSCGCGCKSCGCGSKSCGCGCKSGGCSCERLKIYFPEVEYPNTIIEMNPFYYANCWSF